MRPDEFWRWLLAGVPRTADPFAYADRLDTQPNLGFLFTRHNALAYRRDTMLEACGLPPRRMPKHIREHVEALQRTRVNRNVYEMSMKSVGTRESGHVRSTMSTVRSNCSMTRTTLAIA